jgi:uncharacterized protein YoxC
MTKRIQVNITTVANTAAIRHEVRNGRKVIVVPSSTLPDNVVMNGIRYPADEIEKSFFTLNRTPAPFGHPKVNGKYVSATDPEGINISHIGAWNENVRREPFGDGSNIVKLDKVIDVEVANQSENGKAVLKAINDGGPVHTSTGLFCELDTSNAEGDEKGSARSIYFDHDAILLNEDGAATPSQGVGMMVNASGDAEEIEVVNSFYTEAERDLDWAVESVVKAVEKQQSAGIMERIKAAITDAVTGVSRETQATNKETEMADEKKLDELSATVNTLAESVKAIAESVKGLSEAQAKIEANAAEAAEAERLDLIKKIVNAGVLDETVAAELTLNVAKDFAAKIDAPKPAASLMNHFGGRKSDADSVGGYDLNDPEAKVN